MQRFTHIPGVNSIGHAELASDYVDARVLAAAVAEPLPVPATARFLRLSGNGVFYYNTRAAAIVPAADISDGSSPICIAAGVSRLICLDGITSISVIAPAATVVSAEWFAG